MDQQPEMAKTTKRIASLIVFYYYNNLSDAEKIELDKWVAESDENKRLLMEATDKEKVRQGFKFMQEVDVEKKLREVKDSRHLQFNEPVRQKPRPVIMMKEWIAAAVLLLTASLSFILSIDKKRNIQADILPGSTKATLTLHDGRKIELVDTTKDGTLATQGNSIIKKTSGKLTYQPGINDKENDFLYNTVATPMAGTYPLTLSDGTNIWLNAATSIRFPTTFTGKERNVTLISGEAYFEVVKKPGMPFKVEIKDRGMLIEVVGTHFNVNAYPDQDSTKVTLLEGEIKVVRDNKIPETLKPDEEARVPTTGQTNLVKKADVLTAIAWKNETFRFDHTDMRTIMSQISRWYDVQVVYEAELPEISFVGKIGRNNNLSQVVNILQLNGVYCEIRGRQLIVKDRHR